ncbi:hypothetical protein VSDG_04919 [Cytospora chrysosperma]|uniref:Heterokaryon incompatibility domain-containing protein n=1 Tax=Cytospora chrysosperma TaxID=252740 RepID=A0A423W3R0_CYTCH|nr:hypothetical protein VSDG_04919 [Valsa sordida]
MSSSQSPVEAVICKIPLEALWKSQSLDISRCGTPGRYRLMSCADFIDAGNLAIHEYVEFPECTFAAISYVWQGNTPGDLFDERVFNVPVPQDAAPGDPIGIEVLHDACVAAMARGATHLWLDRICIMQMSETDKRWQIQRMYDIYQRCHVCIVVPGGIQCLVRLDEETQWIHRGWTLQEAVAPRPESVHVLFSWRLGSRRARAGEVEGNIGEVTPSKSAMTSLSLIVDASTTGHISIENGETRLPVEVRLFSSHPADRSYRDFPFWGETRRVLAPNVGALARAMSVDLDQDAKYHSIWQSALMRTSSRPVDMVFSIMGLFGVALKPSDFGKGDRVRATIALAQAIMKKGGRATWLAAALNIPPSRQISTFPKFPRTTVSGKAFVKIAGGLLEVSLMMENEYPVAAALVPMPTGSMDDEGYITFTAKATCLQSLPDSPAGTFSEPARPAHVQAIDGSCWATEEDTNGVEGEAFAVIVGFFVGYYPGATPAHDTKNIRAMIVEKHAHERFHVRSYLKLSRVTRAWVQAWPERTFSIGGPALKVVEDLGEELPVVSVPREQYLNNPHSGYHNGVPSLEDQVIRKTRWAFSQKTLEQKYGNMR